MKKVWWALFWVLVTAGCSAAEDADMDGFPRLAGDCDDGDADVFPAQSIYFETARGDGTFDYNCNTRDDARWDDGDIAECGSDLTGLLCASDIQPGWATVIPPECGEEEVWIVEWECVENSLGFYQECKILEEITRTQSCR